MRDDPNKPARMTKEQAEGVMKHLGLERVLNEPASEMSKYDVTKTFTEYGDPLAPFRGAFAPLANTDVRSVLEQASAEGVFDEDESGTLGDRERALADAVRIYAALKNRCESTGARGPPRPAASGKEGTDVRVLRWEAARSG